MIGQSYKPETMDCLNPVSEIEDWTPPEPFKSIIDLVNEKIPFKLEEMLDDDFVDSLFNGNDTVTDTDSQSDPYTYELFYETFDYLAKPENESILDSVLYFGLFAPEQGMSDEITTKSDTSEEDKSDNVAEYSTEKADGKSDLLEDLTESEDTRSIAVPQPSVISDIDN